MITIPGYRDLSCIYESVNSRIYRCRREQDDLPVILKLLREDYPTAQELIRYRQEYKITKLLSGRPGIIQAVGTGEHGGTFFIVLEDFGADSLKNWIEKRKFTLTEKLSLAIRMAASIGEVHAAKIIHKDINLANMVYNPETDTLKLIDFGISTHLTREHSEICSPNVIEGTLAYISPEQTGRMNRAVDYRTDFYSLGVSLYQLITGDLPFTADNLLELIHCHMAMQAVPPHGRDNRIPVPISDIIMKLMSKTAEERYQSAVGIRMDLQECLDQLKEKGQITAFSIGSHDFSSRLVVPQKLYGREKETEILLNGFDRVSRGGKELMLVSGYSGIGKTSLVKELYRPLTMRRGYFISGKFDLLQRNRPYSAIVDAFAQLVSQLLTETEEQLDRWRSTLREALGSHGKIITDLIPDLQMIIGDQGEVEPLPPVESQNRFNLLFQHFVGAFTTPDHPLVVFIDDLQWADLASLQLIGLLVRSLEIGCLYIIGAYRDNEVGLSHPLNATVGEIRKDQGKVGVISLSPLNVAHINDMLAETLHREREETAALSELLLKKTGGNPFVLKEFVNALVNEGLLTIDVSCGRWGWVQNSIQASRLAENVADLMVGKIQKLSPGTQSVLKLLACVGNEFDLETASIVVESPPKAALQLLQQAVEADLLIPLSGAYKAIEFDLCKPDDVRKAQYRFSHDRIQQAAYSLIPEAQKAGTHGRIGKLLLERISATDLEERIFEVVNHLNLAYELGEPQIGREQQAQMNLTAGKKAKTSAAYGQAMKYLTAGISLLGLDAWRTHYGLMLTICEEAAEAAYLNGDFGKMDEWIEAVLSHANSALERVRVLQTRILSLAAQNNPHAVTTTAMAVLDQLGFRYPNEPSKLRVILALLFTKAMASSRQIERFVNSPEMTNPNMSAALRVMHSTGSAVYFSNPSLYAFLMCKRMQVLLRNGDHPYSSSLFASFGLVICGVLGDIEMGYRLGELALKLLSKRCKSDQKARVIVIVNTFIKHWKDHIESTLTPLHEAYRIGLEVGDIEYAACAATAYCQYSYYAGKELKDLEGEMSTFSRALRHIKQQAQFGYNEIFRQAVLNLLGRCQDPCRVKGEAFDEDTSGPILKDIRDETGLMAMHFQKTLLCCFFGRYPEAVTNADLAATYLSAARGLFVFGRFHFYDSIARLGAIRADQKANKVKALRRVRRNQRRLKRYAHHAPMNHLHLFHLVEAERARALGKHSSAVVHYQNAITGARASGFISDEALALELAGDFYLTNGYLIFAKALFIEALHAYERWGAAAKVAVLETRIGQVFGANKDSYRLQDTQTRSLLDWRTTDRVPSTIPDLESVVRASQSISGEIELSGLVEKLMRIVIQVAGAEKGSLIFSSDDSLRVEARVSVRSGMVEMDVPCLSDIPLDECADLSQQVVRYVLRTRENVVLADVHNNGKFMSDAYIVEHKTKSILCIPIMRQERLVGILYLENNQMADAFTPSKLELLQMISAQAAISIDNAKLYHAAQESARVKQEFYDKTTHELRTPLNAIINLPEAALEGFTLRRVLRCPACRGLFEDTPQDQLNLAAPCPACGATYGLQRELFQHIEMQPVELWNILKRVAKSGRNLLQVVEQILEIGDLEREKVRLQCSTISVSDLIQQSVDAMLDAAAEHDIFIEKCNVVPDLVLHADRLKIEKIMYHLLDNAIRFSPAREKIEVDVRTDENHVTLMVRDHGIGIAPEHHKMIFESFRQVDGTTTRDYGGTGTGLAIAKKLVELHGGEIWVESELGQGSTFYVELPRQNAEKPKGN